MMPLASRLEATVRASFCGTMSKSEICFSSSGPVCSSSRSVCMLSGEHFSATTFSIVRSCKCVSTTR